MTYKEKMMEIHPDLVSYEYWAGVLGCPDDYFSLPSLCVCGSMKHCEKCWNQEYKGEEVIK